MFIGEKKIVRLRYTPESKRSLVTFEELKRRIEQELAERELERRKAAKKGERSTQR